MAGEDLKSLIDRIIDELVAEGFEPNVMLAGPSFIEHTAGLLRGYGLKVYKIEELGYDAIITDSKYLGQIKKASKRISIEPLLVEGHMWEELKNLEA
ncbi:family 4B encapsulin nanocompartment shell protein [Thermococcus sp.]|uniref:family 4B encapsulin nanocompartment shell protein n=1 Tax=Thermococcus sp. TaxID=35749 RepID=UPI00260B9410|nr:family 4B encapsulin nanocompartment shell protein [Thermococcus sp.]